MYEHIESERRRIVQDGFTGFKADTRGRTQINVIGWCND